MDTCMQSMPPLAHCPVSDAPIKAEQLVNQTVFQNQVVDITNLITVDWFLQNPPSPQDWDFFFAQTQSLIWGEHQCFFYLKCFN